MSRTAIATIVLLGGAALFSTCPVRAADDGDGTLTTTAELVDVCSRGQTAADAGADAAFCQGFMVGTYQFADAMARGPEGVQLICVPEPRPSVADATAAFVTWANANPQFAQDPPTDSVMRWATVAYPCKQG